MERVKTKKQDIWISAIYIWILAISLIVGYKLKTYQSELEYIKDRYCEDRVIFEKNATKRNVFYSEDNFVKPVIELRDETVKFNKNTTYKLSYKKDNEKTYHVIADNIKFNKRNEVKCIKLADNIDYNEHYSVVLEKLNNTDAKTVIDIRLTENV